MQPVIGDSLLDEADFLAELEALEHGMSDKRRPTQDVAEPAPARRVVSATFAEPYPAVIEPVVVDERPSIAGQIAAAAMFMLMMGVGAAGAALVFHDRVVRILARW